MTDERISGWFDVESSAWHDAASRLPKTTTETSLCDVCKQPLEFPADDDPAFAGNTSVTSKCRHTIRVQGGEAAPQTFEEWWNTEPVAGIWKTNHLGKQIAYAAWNAAKASSPVVARKSEIGRENLMLKEFINDIYGGAAQGLLAYSRFRRKREPLIKDVRGKE